MNIYIYFNFCWLTPLTLIKYVFKNKIKKQMNFQNLSQILFHPQILEIPCENFYFISSYISAVIFLFLCHNCKAINFCECIATDKFSFHIMTHRFRWWSPYFLLFWLSLRNFFIFSLSKENFLFQLFLLFAWRGKKVFFIEARKMMIIIFGYILFAF